MTDGTPPAENGCERCLKESVLCVCAGVRPKTTKTRILILQHPQEPDKDLGSARLAHLALPSSTLKVGLSWPNMRSALGSDEVVPSRWAVLHLGSGMKGRPEARVPREPLMLVSKKGEMLPDQERLLRELDGIVVLDGTWSQAKTLWWRNAWLLKLKRAILAPARGSLYRELRREPRRECLSTIESIALTLDALGEPPATGEHLRGLFESLLGRKRDLLRASGRR